MRRFFLGFLLTSDVFNFQASGDYNPSFVTEALKEIEYSDIHKQDIELVKDVAAMAYAG